MPELHTVSRLDIKLCHTSRSFIPKMSVGREIALKLITFRTDNTDEPTTSKNKKPPKKTPTQQLFNFDRKRLSQEPNNNSRERELVWAAVCAANRHIGQHTASLLSLWLPLGSCFWTFVYLLRQILAIDLLVNNILSCWSIYVLGILVTTVGQFKKSCSSYTPRSCGSLELRCRNPYIDTRTSLNPNPILGLLHANAGMKSWEGSVSSR